MTPVAPSVPPELRAAAALRGTEGERWLASLPETALRHAASWGLELGYAVPSPSALLIRARRRQRPVTLKIMPPGPRFEAELRVLRAAAGRGYPRVLGQDRVSGSVLLESLGAPVDLTALLAELGPDRVTSALARVLSTTWELPLGLVPAVSEHTHAASCLADEIRSHPLAPGLERYAPVVERALAYAEQRVGDSDLRRHVVVHGQPTPAHLRTLAPRPGAEDGIVLTDPIGFRCEREFDLAMVLADANRDLLAHTDPVVAMRGWCAHLAQATDADAEVIWQWSYLQRVAAGVRLAAGSEPVAGQPHLRAAAALISRARG